MDISQPMDYPYLIKSILSTLPYVFVTQTLGGFRAMVIYHFTGDSSNPKKRCRKVKSYYK